MQYKGYNFRVSKTLGWRMANPKTDFYTPSPIKNTRYAIEANYCVIVKVNDCPRELKGDKLIYHAENIPCIPITGHSTTNMIYGIPKEVARGFKVYIETPIYLVYDGRVYTAISKKIKYE
jgi:hypothetical protein